MTLPKTQTALGIDIPFDTLQAIRFGGALLESELDIHLPPAAAPVFAVLAQRFGVTYSIGLSGVPVLSQIAVEHEKPACRLGDHTWPLVYPHHVIRECRRKWLSSRSVRFSFCGLMTQGRRRTLQSWTRRCLGKQSEILIPGSPREKLRRLYRSFRIPYNRKCVAPAAGLSVFASDGGRFFPEKVWDEDYYNTLAASQFTLCPNGDFVWTYRFFEAIFCGAIPIVEETCPLYDGFEYYTMADPLSSLQWSEEIAARNFLLAQQRLTIPANQLTQLLLNHV